MDIHMIWAKEDGYVWLVEAWDDDSVSDNSDGWDESKDKAGKVYGADNVRIIKATVDFEKVLAAFKPAETTLTIAESEQ